MLALFLITVLGTSTVKAHEQDVVVAQRNFTENCSYAVFEKRPPLPLSQKIEMTCGHRHLFTYDLGGVSGFSNIDVIQDNRIVLSWERGKVAGVTIVQVQDGGLPSAKIVFERESRCGVEVLEEGNVLLAHVGRLLRDGEAEIAPRATNVYVWTNGEYRFSRSYNWRHDYRVTDRYCILFNPKMCPGVQSETPIPDDGS